MNYHTLPEIESYYCCGIWERSDAGELSTGHQQGAPGTSHEGETEDQGKPATPSNYIKVQPHSDKRDNKDTCSHVIVVSWVRDVAPGPFVNDAVIWYQGNE